LLLLHKPSLSKCFFFRMNACFALLLHFLMYIKDSKAASCFTSAYFNLHEYLDVRTAC